MNKKQLIDLMREQRPEPPIGFEERIDSQLAQLMEEGQAMKRKYRVLRVLAAAVLLVLLAGTALALGYPGLIDYLQKRNIKPLAGTEELIQTELGSQQDANDSTQLADLVAYVVEEAVYDGQTVVVQLLVSLTNPKEYALLHTGIQDIPEEVYSGIGQSPDGCVDWSGLVRKDGKRIIDYSLRLSQADETAEYRFEQDTLEALELEDGSVRIWLEGSVVEGRAEAVELVVYGGYDFYDQMRKFGWAGYSNHIEKRIRLETSVQTRGARLIPVGEAKGERFEILEAMISFYPVQGQIAVEYSYLPDVANEPMGIDFRVYDAEQNRIEQGSSISSTLLERRADGTEVWRKVNQIQAFDTLPEKIYLEAKVIGEEQTLGRLEFYVREATEEELSKPEPTQGDIYEKKAGGLMMKPVGSWEGKYIRLLEGSVGLGRSVEISFDYTGEKTNVSGITVHYKDASGNTIGVPINRIGVIGQDSFTLTEMLDGSGWPIQMVMEFEMNGEILDVFTAELQQVYAFSDEP